MNDTKIVAYFLVVISLFGLWLNHEGKLQPVVDEITNPATTTPLNGVTLSEFGLAFIVYLFVMSLLTPRAGFMFTLVIVLGALFYNSEQLGQNAVIPTLFGSAPNALPTLALPQSSVPTTGTTVPTGLIGS
jgi:hypothetical protein